MLYLMPNEDTYYADGFEDCIIGVLTEGEVPRVVYDKWGMVTVLQEEGMTWEDAVEFLEFNVWGAYIGPGTPVYLRTFEGTTEQKIDQVNEFVEDMSE